MATKLIFIHGRNQQGKDPAQLREHWISSLREGLAGIGRTLDIADADIHFPYFGDLLHDLTNEDSLEEAEDVIGDDGEASPSFSREVLGEMLDEAGVSAEDIDAEIDPETEDAEAIAEVQGGGALTWEWVQAGLSIIDRFVPGASGASLAYATNDVAAYLNDADVSGPIDDVVAAAFAQCDADDRVVVVGHSLGSVIGYKVLSEGGLDHAVDVAAFVTIGSPLGVRAIRNAVAPIVHPPTVGTWLNAFDQRDVVALFPLDEDNFPVTPPIINHAEVDNPTPNHHRIEGYLTDPTVALTIREALTSGSLPPVLARRRAGRADPETIEDLRTPCLIVDESVFEANCAAMDSKRSGLTLRPHVKAFKSTAIATRLAGDNHTAFCAATVREIEGLVAAGLTDDLLLANETLDTARLGALADKARITVAVDSDDTLDAAILGGVRSVLIDVDVGLPRCGCSPEEAPRLAERARAAGLEVRGVMGYEGHLMMVEDRASRIRKVERSMAILLEAADRVGGDGPEGTIISGGGTGTFDTNTWVNEIQAGSYTLMDTHYDSLDLPFQIALEVLATVISVSPATDRLPARIIVDAGLKSLGMDHGNPSWSGGSVLFCSDEHVTLAPDHPSAWRVGDRVRLHTAHVDPTVAKHDAMWLHDGGRIIDRWAVDLRQW